MKLKRIISVALVFPILFCALGLTFSTSAATSDTAQTSSLGAYDKYLKKVMDTVKADGIAYVTKNGSVIGFNARGMQNTKENIEMNVDTLFPIGSISKQFCATAILILNEQGKLSINDKLSMYFPEYEIGKDVTIHHLLSMRSGIRDHINEDEDYKGCEIPTLQYPLSTIATYKENQKSITNWLFTQQLKFTPGTKHAYSNANYLLLSMIVEKVSGEKYSDFVQKNIFDKLSMTNTGFYEDLVESEKLAEHRLEEGDFPADAYCKGLSQGAGDLVSNAKDIDKWLTSISHRTLLTDESYDMMTKDYGENYGYGVYTDTQAGTIHHPGVITTYESCALTIPELDVNIFVVTNDVGTVSSRYYTMETFAMTICKKFTGTSVIGDVTDDKEISIIDATVIQCHIAKLVTLDDAHINSGDTNGDGDLSILDATEIQFYLAKK